MEKRRHVQIKSYNFCFSFKETVCCSCQKIFLQKEEEVTTSFVSFVYVLVNTVQSHISVKKTLKKHLTHYISISAFQYQVDIWVIILLGYLSDNNNNETENLKTSVEPGLLIYCAWNYCVISTNFTSNALLLAFVCISQVNAHTHTHTHTLQINALLVNSDWWFRFHISVVMIVGPLVWRRSGFCCC